MKVLVIDDDEDIRFLVTNIFTQEGHEAVESSNAVNGVQELARSNADVVVIDIGMPKIDGKKVIGWIREGNEDIPIVVISGDSNHQESVIQLGANLFFEKPLPSDFYDQVIKLVG